MSSALSGFYWSTLICVALLLMLPHGAHAVTDSSNFTSVTGGYITHIPNTRPIPMTRAQAQGANQGSPARAYNANVQCSGSALFTFQQNISQSFSGRIPILASVTSRTRINYILGSTNVDIIYGYIRGNVPTFISRGFDSVMGGPFNWAVSRILSALSLTFFVDKMLETPSRYDIVCWYVQPQILWRNT